MRFNGNKMVFDDKYELLYELFNTLELKVRPDGTVMDENNGNIIAFNGKMCKATIDPSQIHYPGENEIDFDILGNIRLTTMLFGYYMEKRIQSGLPFRSYYNTEKKDDNEIKYTCITVVYDHLSGINSDYYHNKCLAFIQLLFNMEEEEVDLHNFDIITEEELEKIKKRRR